EFLGVRAAKSGHFTEWRPPFHARRIPIRHRSANRPTRLQHFIRAADVSLNDAVSEYVWREKAGAIR
ncbi:MAG: hypothetical protein RIA65_17145, partial [Woeseia sp.]